MSSTRSYAAVLLAAAFIMICLFGAPARMEAAEAGPKDKETPPPEYLIGPEDVLDISVWKNADLSMQVTVRPDGNISLPLIGDVAAGGKTPEELKAAIVERLKEYQESAVASVIVKEVNSYRIYILGEVVNPGSYQLKRRTTVLQAIAIAGGFTKYASKNKLVVVRDRTVKGEEKIPVKFDSMVDPDARLNTNLILKPGDTIFVP